MRRRDSPALRTWRGGPDRSNARSNMERLGGLFSVGFVATAFLIGGCSQCESRTNPEPDGSVSEGGPAGSSVALSKQQADQVLAKVGNRSITLGEYAAVLERMNRFERMRFQAADRRKDLLDELVNVELLAQEAERRGLQTTPEYKMRVQQIMREAVLAKVRQTAPNVDEISKVEVRRYYDDHRDEFQEPERRRIAHILVKSKEQAESLLDEAKRADPVGWGALVRAHSLDAAKWGQDVPSELIGDRGIVTASPADDTKNLPAELRKALFEIKGIGDIYPQVVKTDEGFHIVRLIGKSDARSRSLDEAQRAIRVAVVRDKVREAERKFEEDLRRRFPVTVDQKALATITLPPATSSAKSVGSKGP